jgi:hypothetical protein
VTSPQAHFAVEETRALNRKQEADVVARAGPHPNLKTLAVHDGGYLASYAGRMDHAWGARSDSRGTPPNPPTSYLKKLYFDTVVFTSEPAAGLGAALGSRSHSDGTDFPFDMGEYDPVGHVCEPRRRRGRSHLRGRRKVPAGVVMSHPGSR